MYDEPVPPILCAHLPRRVDEKLIDLLGSLTSAEWNLQTVAPLWKVRRGSAPLRHRFAETLYGSRFLQYGNGADQFGTRSDCAGKSSESGRGHGFIVV
jgi:hypothetical protein